MSHEDTVKSSSAAPEPPAAEEPNHPADTVATRWWRRWPELGIAAGLVSGVAGVWLLRALGRPSQTGESALLYMITLPIALLLPALALFGMLIAWHSFAAMRGMRRLVMAAPAVAAATANILAIGMFLRFVLQIFFG